MDFERILKLTAGMAHAQREFSSSYDAGRDCGLNGANMRNCHFAWFISPQNTAEWERGKSSALNGNGDV